MQISAHQYRFLKTSVLTGNSQKVSRRVFESIYSVRNIKGVNLVRYVTETLERLIDNGWMVGYGIRTPKRWFIQDVRITREGMRTMKEYEKGKQPRLPMKMKSLKIKT